MLRDAIGDHAQRSTGGDHSAARDRLEEALEAKAALEEINDEYTYRYMLHVLRNMDN